MPLPAVAAAILPVAEAAVLSAGSEELVVPASAQLGAGGHTSELSAGGTPQREGFLIPSLSAHLCHHVRQKPSRSQCDPGCLLQASPVTTESEDEAGLGQRL